MAKEQITAATCLSCGLCCVSLHDQDSFCDVTERDEERLGAQFVRLHVLQPHPIQQFAEAISGGKSPAAIKTRWRKQRTGPMKGMSACACVALRGTLLESVECSVYERRPEVCRKAVRPGDRSCRWLREHYRAVIDEVSTDAPAASKAGRVNAR